MAPVDKKQREKRVVKRPKKYVSEDEEKDVQSAGGKSNTRLTKAAKKTKEKTTKPKQTTKAASKSKKTSPKGKNSGGKGKKKKVKAARSKVLIQKRRKMSDKVLDKKIDEMLGAKEDMVPEKRARRVLAPQFVGEPSADSPIGPNDIAANLLSAVRYRKNYYIAGNQIRMVPKSFRVNKKEQSKRAMKKDKTGFNMLANAFKPALSETIVAPVVGQLSSETVANDGGNVASATHPSTANSGVDAGETGRISSPISSVRPSTNANLVSGIRSPRPQGLIPPIPGVVRSQRPHLYPTGVIRGSLSPQGIGGSSPRLGGLSPRLNCPISGGVRPVMPTPSTIGRSLQPQPSSGESELEATAETGEEADGEVLQFATLVARIPDHIRRHRDQATQWMYALRLVYTREEIGASSITGKKSNYPSFLEAFGPTRWNVYIRIVREVFNGDPGMLATVLSKKINYIRNSPRILRAAKQKRQVSLAEAAAVAPLPQLEEEGILNEILDPEENGGNDIDFDLGIDGLVEEGSGEDDDENGEENSDADDEEEEEEEDYNSESGDSEGSQENFSDTDIEESEGLSDADDLLTSKKSKKGRRNN